MKDSPGVTKGAPGGSQEAIPAPPAHSSRDPLRSGDLSGATPLWIAARRLVRSHAQQFFKRWEKVLEDFDADDIHDLRVASRRLREAIALFEPCFPGKALARCGDHVKQVTETLGGLRNTDEAILFFSGLSDKERRHSSPELRDLLDHLALERVAARSQLERDLARLSPSPLKAELDQELDRPKLFANRRTDPFQEFATFADAAVVARALPLGELIPRALDEADAQAQHKLRIAVKKLRYRLEILEPLLGTSFPQFERSLKRHQDLLGRLHDLDIFAEIVLDRVAGAGQQDLLRVITARRASLFASFTGRLASHPLDQIAERARSIL